MPDPLLIPFPSGNAVSMIKPVSKIPDFFSRYSVFSSPMQTLYPFSDPFHMNVSRINSKLFRHASHLSQPVNRISYFLLAFSLLYFTIMLLPILKAIVHKIYRQTIEQGHQTETGLLISIPPKLSKTQALYGTFIPFRFLNASSFYSLRYQNHKPTQNQCYPNNVATRIHQTLNHARHNRFLTSNPLK